MKKIQVLFMFLFLSGSVFSQSYLGYVLKSTALYTQPNDTSKIVEMLERGNAIYIETKQTDNGFLKALIINSNNEGYIRDDDVQIDKQLQENEEGVFTPTSKIENSNSQIIIKNSTKLNLLLKLNDKRYSFDPGERKSIDIAPGSYSYRASAAGVLPNFGTETFKRNQQYEWEFYVSSD